MQEDDRAVAAAPELNGAGLWPWLLGLFVLALVGTLLLFGFLLTENRSQAEAKALTDGANLAKVLERQLNTSLRRLDADLQGMAGRIRPQEMAPQNADRYRNEWTRYLNALKVNFAEVKDFYVIDAKGDVLYSSGVFRQFNVAERSHFKLLSTEPVTSMVWTDVVVSKADNRPTIVFARGVRASDGTFWGVVSVTVDLDYFQKILAAVDLGSQGLVGVRDTQNNKLLIRQPPIPAEVNKASKSTNFDRIVQGEKQGHSVFTSPLDGKTRYTTFLVLDDFPFFIYVALGEDDVLAAWRSQLRVSSVIALTLLLLVGFALWRLWRAELARQLSVAELVTARNNAEESARNLALALQDKDALLKEVHHRVKNNLQVITSLLRLEGRRSNVADTKAVLSEMQGRIRAMALLHESLYRTGTFASVDLGNYLRQLATQAFQAQSTHAGAIQLELELASVQVGMDQAIPCGLLVNELVSNCLKHAFPEGVTGKVNIALQPLDTQRQWRLRVSDTGAGLPPNFEEKRKNSLGLQLAGDLARQIGGTLEITPGQAAGATFTVNFTAIEPTPLVMPV